MFSPLHPCIDVFTSIQSSTATYGVVPFENSTYGTVLFTLDLLVDRENQYADLLVCGELYLPFITALLGIVRSPNDVLNLITWLRYQLIMTTILVFKCKRTVIRNALPK